MPPPRRAICQSASPRAEGPRESALMAASSAIPAECSCRGLCWRRMQARQADCEFGELADPAVDGDRAAVLLGDDVPADREAEARPLAGRLGGEERLEQLVPDLGRNAGAVVPDTDLDRLAEIE